MNIEKHRLEKLNSENPFEFKLEANFDFYNRSATEEERAEFFDIGSEISTIYAPGEHFYMLLGEVSYVENNANKILNNGQIHLRSTFNFRRKFSPELFTQAQYDDFRGLSERYVVGGTIRWNSIRSEKLLLAFSAGPMYEYENWKVPASQSAEEREIVEEVQFVKLSTNLIIRWTITEYLDLNSIVYYQVGYDENIDATRNRISNSTNLNLRITDKIGFKTGLRMAYEDRPIVPITKFIYSIENGINLNF
jgi:putative salt-induced outer membrane protein YdiY